MRVYVFNKAYVLALHWFNKTHWSAWTLLLSLCIWNAKYNTNFGVRQYHFVCWLYQALGLGLGKILTFSEPLFLLEPREDDSSLYLSGVLIIRWDINRESTLQSFKCYTNISSMMTVLYISSNKCRAGLLRDPLLHFLLFMECQVHTTYILLLCLIIIKFFREVFKILTIFYHFELDHFE